MKLLKFPWNIITFVFLGSVKKSIIEMSSGYENDVKWWCNVQSQFLLSHAFMCLLLSASICFIHSKNEESQLGGIEWQVNWWKVIQDDVGSKPTSSGVSGIDSKVLTIYYLTSASFTLYLKYYNNVCSFTGNKKRSIKHQTLSQKNIFEDYSLN